MELTREYILRLQKNRQGATGGGSGAAGNSGNYVTPAQLDSALANKVDVSFFSRLFELYNGDGTTAAKIETNAALPEDTSKLNIKAPFDFWSQRSVSALGKGAGGSSSVFDESAMWTALGGSIDNKQIALSHLTTALNGYVKGVKVGETTYNPNASGIVDLGTITGRTYAFATGATNGTFKVTPSVGDAYEVAIKGLAALAYKASLTAEDIPNLDATKITTGILGTDRIPGLAASKIVSGTLDAARIPSLSWNKITTDKPTTLAGYGITDAKIENGVITLGGNSITPLTDAKLKSGYEWWGQKLNASGKVNGNMVIYHSISGSSVWASDYGAISIRHTSGSQPYTLGLAANESGYGEIQASQVGVGGTSLILQKLGGNVGIGTTSPYTNLDVNGGVKANKFYFYKPNAGNDTNAIYLVYDSANGGVHLVGAGFYSDSFVSTLGKGDDGGASTFDEAAMWTALGGSIDNKQIALSHLSTALSSYATQTWVTQQIAASATTGTVTAVKVGTTTYNPSSGVVSLPAYPSTLDNIADGSSRKLANYLPLTGGTMTGNLTVSGTYEPRVRVYKDNVADDSLLIGATGNHGLYTDGKGFWCYLDTSGNGHFVGNADSSTTSASCSGNSATATKLQTPCTINGTPFDGTAGITTTKWGTARNITIKDASSTNAGTPASIDGSAAVTLLLPSTIKASLTGNADTATTASKLSTTSKTAWGRTYWTSDGIPTDISGNMTGVGDITSSSSYSLRDSSSNPYLNLRVGSQNWYVQSLSNGIYIGSTSPLSLKVDASGNVTVVGTLGVTGATTLSNTLSVTGDTTLSGNLSIANGKRIYFKNTSGAGVSGILIDSSNNFVIGEGMTAYNTYLRGSSLTFQTGSSHTERMTIDANGRVYVVNGSQGLRIGDALLTWDSTNNAIKVSAINGSGQVNFYATGGVSALGAGSGSSGGGIDADWLKNNDVQIKRLGIGVAPSSSYQLNVYGASNFTGAVTINNNLSVNSGISSIGGISTSQGSISAAHDITAGGNGLVYNRLTVGKTSVDTSYIFFVNGSACVSNGLYLASDVYIKYSAPASGVTLCNITAPSGLTVNGSTSWSSDMRKKDVVSYVNDLDVNKVAKAPVFRFTWKDKRDSVVRVGTSAQYWQGALDSSVMDMGEYGLMLDYNAITIASAVVTARKVVDHELHIKQLEERVLELESEIKQLKAA